MTGTAKFTTIWKADRFIEDKTTGKKNYKGAKLTRIDEDGKDSSWLLNQTDMSVTPQVKSNIKLSVGDLAGLSLAAQSEVQAYRPVDNYKRDAVE